MSHVGQYRSCKDHWEVEGVALTTGHIFSRCKELGFTGTYARVNSRLHAGHTTWAALCAPVRDDTVRMSSVQRKREEMRKVIAELDARKAQMGVS